jgi:hypothetical protein
VGVAIDQIETVAQVDAEMREIAEALTYTRDDDFRAELLKTRDDLLDLRNELPRQRAGIPY